jgi:hypothetical protein
MEETLELTPEEQESLAIGESMAAQEQEMLAGKFENAEQLEKAYLELQSKLGQRQEMQQPDEGQADVEESQAEEQEEDGVSDLIRNAAQSFMDKGEIPEDMLTQFDNMSSRQVVDAFMKMETPQQQAQDLTDSEVNSIQNMVGGKQGYENLMQWSSENLPEAATAAFDNLVSTGDAAAIQLATMGLAAAYQQANGYEGNLATGRAVREQADVFRSQAEVVAAMQDPRYDNDPAYRDDVFAKLGRSNIDM